MGPLRQLILFGSFAVVGLGLALGIGLSSTPPPDDPADDHHGAVGVQPAAAAGPVLAEREQPDGYPMRLPLQAPTLDPPFRPDLVLPPEPQLVIPYPARGYQVPPEGPAAERLQAAGDALKRQATGLPPGPEATGSVAEAARSLSDTLAPKPTGEVSAPPEVLPTPEAPKVAPAAGSAPSTPSVVRGEGDGRLVINIQDTDIRKVLELLSEQGNLNILASKSVQGNVSATLSGVDLDSALQAILRSTGFVAHREGQFIYVGTPEDFDEMARSADQIGTRVYQPNYVKASDLKDLITPLLTEKVGVVSVTAPAEKGIETDDTQAGGNDFAGNEALLVRDYEKVLAEIDQVVREIDIRPMQVHIEAMILSVKLGDTYKFGVDFKKFVNGGNFVLGWGSPVDALDKVQFNDGGLKFGFIDGGIGTFLDALEHIGDTNVIATPRLMVLNKHRADILIGRQEGYVSTTAQTETATTQSVQFLDLGTQLRLRPFITPDGLIRMEVHPELSDGAVEVKGGFTLPNKDVTQVTTNIMVRDGCTVVIGGLMQEQLVTNTDQIPLLGNLPAVGWIFRSKEEKTNRRELIVLITPRIVQEPDAYREGDYSAAEFHRRQEVYRDKMSPIAKRSVGQRYFRMAQRAWAMGEGQRALRFAEMSVHFDPLNRAAIDLRSDIWLGHPVGPHTLPPAAPYVLPDAAGPLDGQEIAPFLLDEIERPGQTAPRAPSPTLAQPDAATDIDGPRALR